MQEKKAITLIQTNKYLIDNPVLSGIFVAMKTKLENNQRTEREMLADLGMMVDGDFIQDMYADSNMTNEQQLAYKEKLRKEVLVTSTSSCKWWKRL
mgnify:CR=1 FL=1